MVCCFSGHRDIAQSKIPALYDVTKRAITYFAEQGCTEFRSGGACGFDTIAALTVIRLKPRFPQIKLCLYLPCKNQDLYWSDDKKRLYRFVLEKADEVRYINEKFFSGAMQARNRALVNGSDVCICYQEREGGGTAYTVKYAQSHGVRVVNLKNKLK